VRVREGRLGFDAEVDHKGPEFAAKLATACPTAIDVYFENVGGAVWQAVLPLLNKFARVPVSGLVAQYNAAGPGDGIDQLPATMHAIPVYEPDGARLYQLRFGRGPLCRFPARGWCRHRRWPHPYREDFVDGLEKRRRPSSACWRGATSASLSSGWTEDQSHESNDAGAR